MANGMSGLYVGTSGVQSAQIALNATAHNLSNINTEGYTRQQVKHADKSYMGIGNYSTASNQFGLGVDVQVVRRVRDDLIDAAYRQENGRLGFYESQYDALSEVESLMGEMQGVTFQSSMTNLWNSINELSKDPSSTVARESLIETSTVFIERANSVFSSLKDYQSTLNTKVINSIKEINDLGNTIADLNSKICYIEALGESANDYRDQRDAAIDKLSGYAKVTTKEEDNHMVTVTLEGVAFVASRTCYGMSSTTVPGTQLVKPSWPHLGDKDVYTEGEKINVLDNNDIGELKGLLLARGSKSVNYSDVPVLPEAKDYDMTDPTQAAKYAADMQEYNEKVEYYNENIDPSVILTAMATLDKLVNGIVTSINDILCPETTAMVGGEEVKVLDMDKTDYGIDPDKSVGVELFSRNFTERYVKKTGDDGKEYYVRNDISATNNVSDYTLGNISVNSVASENVTKIPLTTKVGEADFAKAKELSDIWEKEFAAINPSKYSKETFTDFYSNFVGDFADTGNVLLKLVNSQQVMADGYDSQRSQTEGVSSDEELQNMIKYQQAYNAAARYVNTVSEMLEHIITSLGH